MYELKKYRYSINQLIGAVGNIELSQLGMHEIAVFRSVRTHTVSENTYRADICAVRSMLRFAALKGYRCIPRELVVMPKKIRTKPVWITPEQVEKMIQEASNIRDAFLVSLLYSSGLRISEALSLNRGEVVSDGFTVCGKGGRDRLVFTDARTIALMKRYMATREDQNPALFLSRRHIRMSRRAAENAVRAICVAAGIDKHVTPHSLRHSFATDLMRNGADIRYVSEMLGHTNLATTAVYTHVIDEDLLKQYRLHHSTAGA